VSGALAIGLLAALLLTTGDPLQAASSVRALLAIGVLGSYTTVSSFSLQTLSLFRAGRAADAVLNVLLSFVLCLGAAALGFGMVRWSL
jgi:fluoride exporter